MPPGLVSETLAPWRSSAPSRFSRALAISSPKASRNSGNDSRPASRMTGTISVRPPSLRSTSTAMPRLHGAVVDHVRLAVALLEVVRHHRHLLGRRARDRVGDQVREGDAVAGVLELLAARVERRDGDRPERGRGRDLARLVHVAREHRRGALDRRRAGGCGAAALRRWPRRARRPCRCGRRARCRGPWRARRRARRRRAWRPGSTLCAPSSGRAAARPPGAARRLRRGRARRAVRGAAHAPDHLADGDRLAGARRGSRSTVPEAGAGTSASTLSVEISTIVSSAAIGSPTALAHSSTTPSETDSPIAGMTMSTSCAGARLGCLGLGRRGRRGAVRGSDLGEHGADVDRVALGGVHLDDGSVDRRGDLRVDLVGRDLDQGLVG